VFGAEPILRIEQEKRDRMKRIDVRSDTVTRPTDEMRSAMANALVGDDVYGDDPTVNRMQEMAAEILGKEAALFVPSGTMGNQICIMANTRRGDDVIVLRHAHVLEHEAGAASVLSGITFNVDDSEDGIMHAEHLLKHIHEDDIHQPPTTLLCHENPLATGQAVPLDIAGQTYRTAKELGLMVHMDGARIFNAAAALGVKPAEIAACTDTVMACLSKGLCAPVGSIIAGSADFIKQAIRCRKLLGGGMRQVGVLAAAGIIGLETMSLRTGEDNDNADKLADRLSKTPGIRVNRPGIPINMVFFAVEAEETLLRALPDRMLEKHGILMNGCEAGEFRFVAHHDVTLEDLLYAVDCLEKEIAAG